MANPTTNYSWTLPTVGASLNSWGTTLNTFAQDVDTQMKANADSTAVASITSGTIDGTVIGGTTPAAGTFTSVTVDNNTPNIYLDETDGTSTYAIVGINLTAGNFALQTRNSAGAFVSNDYLMTRNASGATDHSWRIGGVEKFSLDTNGVDINSGSIDGTSVGLTTPAYGGFTVMYSPSVNIDGGTIDGTTIGGASRAAGSFTGLTVTNDVDCDTVTVNEIYAEDGAINDPSYTFDSEKLDGLHKTAGGFGVTLSTRSLTGHSEWTTGAYKPVISSINLGSSGVRWDVVYGVTSDFSSDRNLKQDIEELSTAELAVATGAKALMRKYRFIAEVERDGPDAKLHVGVIAQDLEQLFIANGLDPNDYGVIRKSEITTRTSDKKRFDDKGEMMANEKHERDVGVAKAAKASGKRRDDAIVVSLMNAPVAEPEHTTHVEYSVNYNSLFAFIIAAL